MRRSIPLLCALLGSCAAKDRAVAAIAPAAIAPAAEPQASPALAPQRKIIRSGELMLQVDSLARAREVVEAAAVAAGGYLSSAQADDSSESLVLRIPAARFDDVAHTLARAGHLLRESLSAEEITEQYYDVTARLDNARRIETRLLDLVSQKASKVSDLLEVERELGRVREEIERLDGKRRLWDHQVALGTLTVHLWTQPPPEATATAFTTLRGSWRALASTAHGAFLGGVALLPWSPLLALAIFALMRWRRRPTALPQ
jgi:hypothetical protein